MQTRRNFIKIASVGSVALLANNQLTGNTISGNKEPDSLIILSSELLESWTSALLKLQITDKTENTNFGGIMCPACGLVHGRSADAMYPLIHMAHKKNQSEYLDSALLLFRWMEKNVSQPDGSWLNDPVNHSWKGITVFTAIAIAEILKNHSALLDSSFRNELENRLKRAGDFIFENFSIKYGNINYPVTASYGLSLIGTLLDIKAYKDKGRKFAHDSLGFITKNNSFLSGEGGPYGQPSGKGCYSVDLGYNVEESLPALVLYGKLTQDKEVLDAVVPVLQSHIEFMLPDGAWDNSWGTRNFKWTYWGSRTTDGCQPAYALMADRDPRFYKVALKSTELLLKTTYNGLLYGGPHYVSHHVDPCVHHTFCHSKALATILDHKIENSATDYSKVNLPREKVYGSRFFKDIQTYLISVGKFRATVTGYDREYTMTNGHATGGALTLLWHERTGPLLAASMNEYQMKEPNNMQTDNDLNSMPLTPRIELNNKGHFMNICDLSASMELTSEGEKSIIKVQSRLVDGDQKSPVSGEITCQTVYSFSPDGIILEFDAISASSGDMIQIVLPVVSQSSDEIEIVSEKEIRIRKELAVVIVTSDSNIKVLPTSGKRIFNFVPGLEAIPLAIDQPKAKIELMVVKSI